MAKTLKKKYACGHRVCLFCEGKSGTKITKEHVFGLWLKNFFPRDETTTHDEIYVEWPDEIGPQVEKETRTKKQGHVGSKQLKVLCRTCNNEKLGSLENQIKNTLPPLIVGNRANILRGGQDLLATWAVKTAMIAENLKPVDLGIPQSDRSWLLNNMRPPPEKWFVWIARYDGTKWKNLSIYQGRLGLGPSPIARPSDAPHYAQETTFGIGHILFCVVSSSSPLITRFTGWEPDGLFQIWPPQQRSLLWPPLRILDDDDANIIANFFKNSGLFDQSLDPAANWTFTL